MHKTIVQDALKKVKYPGFTRDIISFGLVKDILVDESGIASIRLEITTNNPEIPLMLKKDIEKTIGALEIIKEVHVDISINQPKTIPSSADNSSSPKPPTLEKVRFAIAVASGKGGVGKSTFAVNLACAFEQLLQKPIGLMDCDIYGPSTPLMIGINNRPMVENNLILPLENFGVKVMSMGFLIDDDAPVVWRGPLIMKTIQQFAGNVLWGDLEILVIDLPPGTGDAQLSLVQTMPLNGVIIVTTPQDAAANVAYRGAKMFHKVNVPILGVAENMSFLIDEQGKKNPIFGEGGGQRTADNLETDLLGQIPLDSNVRISSDRGIPIVISHPDSHPAKTFMSIAKQLLEKLEK